MRVTEQTIEAYGFCQALLPVPGTRSRKRCAGYEPTPATVVVTTQTILFGDWSGGAGATDVDLLMAEMTSSETTQLRFARDRDRWCAHCEQPMRVPMLEAEHPVYPHVSDQDPDRLLEMDEAARRQAAAASEQAQSLQDLVLELREARLQDRALIEGLLERLIEREAGNGAHSGSEAISGPEDAETTTDTSEGRTAPQARRTAAKRS